MKAAHSTEVTTGLNKKTGAILMILFVILLGIGGGLLLVHQTQNPQKRAAEIQSGPSCPLNGFTCRWNRESGVSYHYIIRDDSGAVVKEGDIPASSSTDKITITHTPESGKTYTCHVDAKNDCGSIGEEKSAGCSSVPQPQPTIPALPTVTPTATPESPTPSPTGATTSPTPSVTITSTPSPTLPPNVTPSKTPTPTDIVIVNATNTPILTNPAATSGPTKQPTLPTTGLPSASILAIVIVGFVIITLGLAL